MNLWAPKYILRNLNTGSVVMDNSVYSNVQNYAQEQCKIFPDTKFVVYQAVEMFELETTKTFTLKTEKLE